MIEARALARRLAQLPVRLDGLRCRSGRIAVGGYPGGRPTTVVALSGQGHTGHGEHVAFTDDEQQAFVHGVEGFLATGAGPVGAILREEVPAYGRAALEGALIDLALRQAGLGLGTLAGVAEARLRWVRSFAARLDPATHARSLAGELKVDVHPAWSEAAIEALRSAPVAVLDFKEGGSLALCARLSAAFPAALLEDPPAGCAHRRISRDRSLLTESDVAAAAARGEAVNLKSPRLGGFLRLLEALATAHDRGALVYLGGMFEVGPGREQARQVAALFCPEGPNDLAPLEGASSSLEGPSPSRVRLDRVGFGAAFDWGAVVVG